jgi:hypothetical protein
VFYAIMIAILALPVIATEIYLRWIGLGNPLLYYTNASYRYALQPNQHELRREGAHVTIDSAGLRGVPDWSAPADAKILFIGDSITYGGSYVDDKDTFAHQTCVHLAAALKHRFTCGNAGVNGYGTDNMAERIRYKPFNDEAAVVVTLEAEDSIRGLADLRSNYFFTRSPPGPFKALSEAATFLAWNIFNIMRPYGLSYHRDDDFRVSKRSLENLYSALRETYGADRKVLIVLSPFRFHLNGHETEFVHAVQASLGQSGFDVLDMHGPVSKAVTADFYSDDVHLDVVGNHFYGEQIANRLLSYFSAKSGAK